MRKSHRLTNWLAGVLLVGAAAGPAEANTPSVSQMLSFKPIQKGVEYTVPPAAEQDQCKVELVTGGKPGASGWVLRDAKGRLLRKYFDSNADKYPDQWCYYKDGLEVYREVDTNFNGKPDRYQWMHTGGMKTGLDPNEDGVIDAWEALALEELSQEVVKALVSKDPRQLEPLLVTEADLRGLGAPDREIARIRKLQEQSAAKFRQTAAKFPHFNETTRWLHLETGAPSRLPAETYGMKQDVLMYYRVLVLCETGGKHDWVQLGEVVQVGAAWKLVDAPTPGHAAGPVAVSGGSPAPADPPPAPQDTESQRLLKQLAELDRTAPPYPGQGANPAVVRYHAQRVELLQQIIAKAPESDRGLWQRQLADSLATAAQANPAGDTKMLDRLARYAADLAREQPGSDTAAYVVFREITTDYSLKVTPATSPDDLMSAQGRLVDRLSRFVATYPRAEETADALYQLGLIHDLHGPEKAAEARRWYQQLVQQFPSSPEALKAAGALRRLNSEGQRWELGAPAVSLNGQPFSADKLHGKVVIVYYWMSNNPSAVSDFARLKQLAHDYRSLGLEIVGVNVDDQQADAESFVRRHSPPGYQLHASGGADSPLAAHYGLIIFPNLFLVGRDGKVLSHALDVGNIEVELKKLK